MKETERLEFIYMDEFSNKTAGEAGNMDEFIQGILGENWNMNESIQGTLGKADRDPKNPTFRFQVHTRECGGTCWESLGHLGYESRLGRASLVTNDWSTVHLVLPAG